MGNEFVISKRADTWFTGPCRESEQRITTSRRYRKRKNSIPETTGGESVRRIGMLISDNQNINTFSLLIIINDTCTQIIGSSLVGLI